MSEFELRGTFYLGDGPKSSLVAQGEHLMEHLLSVECAGGPVRDAAVSLDLDARTVEVELTVTADALLDAHRVASEAVSAGFRATQDAQERSMEMTLA